MYKKKIIDGVFERVVTYDKRLEYMPNASAGIVCTQTKDFDIVNLVSYTTTILSYITDRNNGRRYLEIGMVNYSRTTIRHVIAFLKEFLPPYIDYSLLRDIYKNNEDIMVLKIPENKDEFKDLILFSIDDYTHYINVLYNGGLAR